MKNLIEYVKQIKVKRGLWLLILPVVFSVLLSSCYVGGPRYVRRPYYYHPQPYYYGWHHPHYHHGHGHYHDGGGYGPRAHY